MERAALRSPISEVAAPTLLRISRALSAAGAGAAQARRTTKRSVAGRKGI
jgi:hypothetical protein